MKLCLYNPHIGVIGQSLFDRIFGNHSFRKYEYFLKYFKKQSRYTIAIVVDGTTSSFPIRLMINNILLTKVFTFLEIYIWLIINKLPLTTEVIFNLNKQNPKSDILFGFAFFGQQLIDKSIVNRSFISKYSGKILLHFTHLFIYTKTVAENLRIKNPIIAVAESNLNNSQYFQKHFNFISGNYVLPWAVKKRYVKKRNFLERKNKSVCLGQIFVLNKNKGNSDYTDFFKSNNWHEGRKMIYDNRIRLANYIDSKIEISYSKERQKNNLIYLSMIVYRRCLQLFGNSDRYFKFDIVDLYNNYRMFIAPEESVEIPTIHFVEGMACGCAFVGLNHPMYKELGLKDKVHYIGYDGTLKDLRKKISYYQKNPKELKQIAERGHHFVTKYFSEENIMELFFIRI